jgi:hypothetical protein
MMGIRKCQLAKRFKQTPNGNFLPCEEGELGGVEMSIMEIEPSKLQAPPVTTVTNILS